MFVCEKCEGVGYHKPGCPDYPMTTTPPPEGTTEPPVECVAVDRDERCLCPGGPASHRPSSPAPAAEEAAVLAPVVPDSGHVLTEYGTTTCPVESVRAEVTDGKCSACGAAVPDSAGLRERVAAAVDGVAVDHPAWGTAHTATRPFTDLGESNYRQFVEDITDAVLAVVGQGEQGCNCGFGGQHDPANPRCRVNDPTEAWLCSGEQGGDDRG